MKNDAQNSRITQAERQTIPDCVAIAFVWLQAARIGYENGY